jgi:hypothetical protein
LTEFNSIKNVLLYAPYELAEMKVSVGKVFTPDSEWGMGKGVSGEGAMG